MTQRQMLQAIISKAEQVRICRRTETMDMYGSSKETTPMH